MARKQHHLSDANSPGQASQGVAAWTPGGPPIEIEANTDYAATTPGYPVIVYPLLNDIGENIYVYSVSVRDPAHGTVTKGTESVQYNPSNSFFTFLAVGEHYDITLDYEIRDLVGRSSTSFIVIRVMRQYDIWVDEDGAAVCDEDASFIIQDPITYGIQWLDEDNVFIIDQDEYLIETEE